MLRQVRSRDARLAPIALGKYSLKLGRADAGFCAKAVQQH
jgi:hypothetical protein